MSRIPSPLPEKRYVQDGVPIDPNDWTVEDWRTLWTGMQAIRRTIAERYRAERERLTQSTGESS